MKLLKPLSHQAISNIPPPMLAVATELADPRAVRLRGGLVQEHSAQSDEVDEEKVSERARRESQGPSTNSHLEDI